MNLQLWLVTALVATASCYLSWRGWKAFGKAKQGCSTGCGCPSASKAKEKTAKEIVLISSDSLKLRNRI